MAWLESRPGGKQWLLFVLLNREEDSHGAECCSFWQKLRMNVVIMVSYIVLPMWYGTDNLGNLLADRTLIHQFFDWLVWLIVRLVDWLVWLMCSLSGWFMFWLNGWLFGWLSGWLMGWLFWLINGLIDWLVNWLVGLLIGLLAVGCLISRWKILVSILQL